MKRTLAYIIEITTKGIYRLARPFYSQEKLESYKPIHLCWWFLKNDLPIPQYFIAGMPEAGEVETVGASNIGEFSFDMTGDYIDQGVNSDFVEKGFAYMVGTTGDPDTSNQTVFSLDPSLGEYTLTIENLTPETSYRVRAYAINSAGTDYGASITVTTQEEMERYEGGSISSLNLSTSGEGVKKTSGFGESSLLLSTPTLGVKSSGGGSQTNLSIETTGGGVGILTHSGGSSVSLNLETSSGGFKRSVAFFQKNIDIISSGGGQKKAEGASQSDLLLDKESFGFKGSFSQNGVTNLSITSRPLEKPPRMIIKSSASQKLEIGKGQRRGKFNNTWQ